MEGPEPGFPRETDSLCPTCITEERYYGRDLRTSGDDTVHCLGASNIKYGRGAVLNIDLTNRCNMMCSPCFANANQIGHPRWTEFGVKVGIRTEPTSAPLLRRIRS